MKRPLSSGWTYFEKWVTIPVFGGASILFAAQLVKHFHETDAGLLLFASVWLTVALVGCWYAWRRKHVGVDDKFLYVTNYWKEIAIPLSEVEHVRYFGLGNMRTVTIYLRSSSKFGRVIKFTPPFHSFFGVDESPVVEELRRAVRQDERNGRRRDEGYAPSRSNL